MTSLKCLLGGMLAAVGFFVVVGMLIFMVHMVVTYYGSVGFLAAMFIFLALFFANMCESEKG